MALISDLFTGNAGNLSGHTSDSGQTWLTPPTPSENILMSGNGTVYANTTVGSALVFINWAPPSADYRINATITLHSNVGHMGLVARGVTDGQAGGTSLYLARYSQDEAGYSLHKDVNGTYTRMGDIIPGGPPQTGDILSLAVSGSNPTTLILSVNGTEILSQQDSSSPLTGPGLVGVWAFGAGNTTAGVHLDSFEVVTTATSFTLSGPSVSVAGSPSTNFTITPNGDYTGTITPTDGSSGGTFTPSSLTWANESVGKTFTYTASSHGSKSISASASPSLTPPNSVSITAFSLDVEPNNQSAGNNSDATLTATLSGGIGALSAETTAGTLSTDTPSSGVSFTLTVPSSGEGTATITVTHDASGASSQATVEYGPIPATALSLIGPTSGLAGSPSSNFTVSANGTIQGSVVVTPSDGDSGGTFSPSTITLSSGTLSGTFTYTINNDGDFQISITNDGGLSNPSPVNYTTDLENDRQLTVNFGTGKSGLNTVGYLLLNTDGSEYAARTTVGVSELVTNSGIYFVVVTLPMTWTGKVVWDTGDSITAYAVDESISPFQIADAVLIRDYGKVTDQASRRSLAASIAMGLNWQIASSSLMKSKKSDGSDWFNYTITSSDGGITSVS